MAPALTLISSMATRPLLADLVAQFRAAHGQDVHPQAAGGVEVAQRILAGEAFDAVVLAADAIDRLIASGQLVAGSRVDLVQSGVAIAVRAGSAAPEVASEADVKHAVLAARTVGYSTGPSGVQLARLFERWGIADALAGKIVQAPPGVPVGSLVAGGEVELGFQQLSELMDLPGITVLGPLPPAIQITTTFSGAVAAASVQPEAVRAFLGFAASAATVDTKRRHGMQPA